ncbi:hypothetical protein SOVF_166100 [Spinacia oleracea]|uniref:Uncharacterized protein n=1 Tax=Spinacia oleracea TaxID=3562 RepID=A0A9R0IVD5_SPIOL|nr:uncharacterized protein LOC110795603 [Spinacia oleracea]KNA08062.1 hypothetical protein SOVF_166100 [Spinacia oleracea]
MGNCLRSQGNLVQILKPDGKILEYKAPVRVNDVLSGFQGYGLSDKLPVLQYLKQNIELVAGRLYYLILLPTQSPKIKKRVSFAQPEKVEESKSQDTSLTIKLVISKQELKEMLENGAFSLDELVSKQQNDTCPTDEESYGNKTWMPALKSISEVDC